MINSSDIGEYNNFGFDGEKYISLQSQRIQERMDQFSGKLYLEIGGKFLIDPHASRVLPGFFHDSKKRIFQKFQQNTDIIFCINAQDLYENRQLSNQAIEYGVYCLNMLEEIKQSLGILAKVSLNRINEQNKKKATEYSVLLNNYGYSSYFRYEIEGYPFDTTKVLSDFGYGQDEYIHAHKDLVLVTGAASSSGKMSTCLGEIYHDKKKGIDSGYAKYETFPVWNLALDHPVNLAYEAATADIGDHNVLDSYHKKYYDIESVNYNRDVEAFEIVSQLAEKFLDRENYTRQYKSPTDMGISSVGECITDENIVKQVCLQEIERRMQWYHEMVLRGEGDEIWVARCKNLLEKLK